MTKALSLSVFPLQRPLNNDNIGIWLIVAVSDGRWLKWIFPPSFLFVRQQCSKPVFFMSGETKMSKTVTPPFEARKEIKVALAVFGVVMVMVAISAVIAGDLNPPGPPTSGTMKTLDEVEPRIPISQADIPKTISEPGSYYLTEDVNSSGTAITVNVDDVTIDLMGYAIKGPDSGTNYGIYMDGGSNVEIRNGTVRDFKTGICTSDTSCQFNRVIRVRSVSNAENGILCIGSGNLIKDCTVSDNGILATHDVYGILAGCGSTVTGNTAHHNGTSVSMGYVHGIYAYIGSTVTGNTAYDNGDSADHNAYGICLQGYNLVDQNTAYSNGTGAASATNMTMGVIGCVYGNNVAP